MNLEKVVKVGQVQKGDILLIKSFKGVEVHKAKKLINGGVDEEEVLLKKRSNIYFIMSLYLAGKSWAKEVQIVRESDE